MSRRRDIWIRTASFILPYRLRGLDFVDFVGLTSVARMEGKDSGFRSRNLGSDSCGISDRLGSCSVCHSCHSGRVCVFPCPRCQGRG